MKLAFILLFLVSAFACMAQVDTPGDSTIYTVVEEPPEPHGGYKEFFKFIYENLVYPAKAQKMGAEGSAFTEFIVEKDGSVSGVRIIKGIVGGCDEEAVRLIKLFGSTHGWKPGKQNGKAVRVRFVLPVKFKLK